MTNEPVLYDSPKYEYASMALLFCQEVLTEQGLTVEADKLRGIEVTHAAMARVALQVLASMKLKGAAEEARGIAQELCARALGLPVMRVAG